MFACRWFQAFVIVSSVATASAAEEVPTGGLNQDDAEIILNVQSSLRRHLISSLADVEEKINEFQEFHSIVHGIIQGLQSRNLDPFKSFKHGIIREQSTPSGMAETIHNLHGPPTLADWKSVLQTIPSLQPPSNIQLTAEHLEKIHKAGEPVAILLTGIHKNDIKLNSRLLGDILYNYRFRDAPDAEMISQNLQRMLERRPVDFTDFQNDPSAARPNAILSDILKYVAGKSDVGVAHQIAQLLPALSDERNIVPLDAALFDVMQQHDYPPDIIQAKNVLSSAVRNNQTGLNLSEVDGSLKGRPPMEKLLMLIAKLTSLPDRSPLWKMVHALYPHVKLTYLASQGKFFRPRTAADVGFLLDSFLTVPEGLNPTVFKEIRRFFSEFNWEGSLKNFDYSRYSRPRPLVIDMFEEMLNNSNKLPVCGVILLGYFLRRNHRGVSGYSWNDLPIEELIIPKTSYPTVSTTAVKRCSDGPPVKIVDPESIIEAMNPNQYSDFVAGLIRFKPIRYAKRRIDGFRAALNDLKNSEYNDGAIIEKILLEMPLNEKAELPPKYVNLCPSEVAAMEEQQPKVPAPSEGLVSLDPFPSTTAGIPSLRSAIISPFSQISATEETSSENTVAPVATPEQVQNSTFSHTDSLNSSTLASVITSAPDFDATVATTPVLDNPNTDSPVICNPTTATECHPTQFLFPQTPEVSSITELPPSAAVEQTTQDVNPTEPQTASTEQQTEQNSTKCNEDVENSNSTGTPL